MKISCVHCGKEMNDAVNRRTAVYKIGKVHCPHCHRQNKRYISELDLHLFSFGNMVIYGVVLAMMCLLATSFYSGNGNFLVMLLVTILAMIIVIVGITNWSYYVYLWAPMKRDWMNQTITEDEDLVTKKIKREFKAYLVLVVIFGVLAMYIGFWCYVVGVGLTLCLMFLRLKIAQKREKEFVRNV